MYLVADINVEICAAKSCKLCTQYCKGCAQCVWVCDNMAKNNAIKMIMIDQLPKAALTDNITYGEKSTTAVLASPVVG